MIPDYHRHVGTHDEYGTLLPGSGYGQPETSGHSGTDTSRERAETEAADGTAGHRQAYALGYLEQESWRGVTWKELAEHYGWHHGQSSATLSNLHKAGKIARLVEKRDRCKVYVNHRYVGDREVERFVPNKGRYPQRGDEVETWLKWNRDEWPPHFAQWQVLDNMLDEYRLAADTGRRLSELGED